MGNSFFYYSHMWGLSPVLFGGFILLVALWSIIWKGLALWRAARVEQPAWFVVLLVLNTVGILEILYLLFFAKKEK